MSAKSGGGSQTQGWLAGVDDSLDNFFTIAPSRPQSSKGPTKNSGSRSGTGTGVGSKRKAELVSRKDDTPVKKAKLSKDGKQKGEQTSLLTRFRNNSDKDKEEDKGSQSRMSKGKSRRALEDLTSVLENSPQRQRRYVQLGSGSKSPTRRKSLPVSPTRKPMARKKPETKKNAEVIELDDSDHSRSDSESIENGVSRRLPSPTSGKTPHQPSKNLAGHRFKKNQPLPTPPSSIMSSSRKQSTDDCSSSPASDPGPSKKEDDTSKATMQTPFTFTTEFAKQHYPTPTSMAIPRLRLISRDAGNRDGLPSSTLNPTPDSDSPLTSLSPSYSSSQDITHVEGETKKKSEASIEAINKESCKSAKADKSKIYTVIPSSQTQYIHYSPTKQKHTNNFPLFKLKAPSLTVIPCSQSLSSPLSASQTTLLSPRKLRKPAPILTAGLVVSETSTTEEGRDVPTKAGVLNFVVPTSQEDERDISLLHDAVPGLSQVVNEACSVGDEIGSCTNDEARSARQKGTCSQPKKRAPHEMNVEDKKTMQSESTQLRFINAMLADLDRLAEEACASLVTVSQVMSRPLDSSSSLEDTHGDAQGEYSVSNSRRDDLDSSQEENMGPRDSARDCLCMQSSVTEPDASQWDEDPFSLTNEAYARYLGIVGHTGAADDSREPSGPPTTCTQNSATQPDSQEEDPFPTLPPASSAESTANQAMADTLLLLSQRQHKCSNYGYSLKEHQGDSSQTESETQPDSEGEYGYDSNPMPDISSPDDTFDMRLLSPRTVRRVIFSTRSVSRFRKRDDLPLSGANSQEGGVDEEEESMSSAVRGFLGMFSQTQS